MIGSRQMLKLRTSFQFQDIEARKDKLQAALERNPRVGSRCRTEMLTRVLESYLIWLDRPVPAKKIHKILKRRFKTAGSGPETDPSIDRIILAIEQLEEAAQKRLGISASLLGRQNALLDLSSSSDESPYREVPTEAIYPGHRPHDPESIPGAVARSIQWFSSEGAGQLHALERSVLALTRLAEIAPFTRVNLPTLVLVCAYDQVSAGFPLHAIYPADRAELGKALQLAARMQTQSLIDLYVRMQSEMLDGMLHVVDG